jgi:hypothetical protein
LEKVVISKRKATIGAGTVTVAGEKCVITGKKYLRAV